MLPMRILIAERMNVVAPIKLMAGTILTCKNANVTPTASASMLVATASGSIVIKLKESSSAKLTFQSGMVNYVRNSGFLIGCGFIERIYNIILYAR